MRAKSVLNCMVAGEGDTQKRRRKRGKRTKAGWAGNAESGLMYDARERGPSCDGRGDVTDDDGGMAA